MKKFKTILYTMFIFIALFYNQCLASLHNEIKTIEQEINIESKMEPEWLDAKSFNGTFNNTRSMGNGLKNLGPYKGLTYYSQADSRWANKLYTSTNNSNQTMKSSGCGPTAAAIVVSSSKGTILPTTMADIFVKNGFRTVANGTSWNAFPFIANYFAFKNYEYTTNFNKAIDYLKKGYYIIVSCGNGLFTTNGHYVVLVNINNNTLSIYDTYLYNGKFDIPSRRGKVSIKGNTIYCTINNFIKYSNYRAFWCYSNDHGLNNKNNTSITSNNYLPGIYQIATKSLNLRIRKGPGTNYKISGSFKKGTKVNVDYTKGFWGHLSNNKGWICLKYCKKVNGYMPGSYKVTASTLKVRSGPSTNYRIVTRLFKGSKQGINYTKGNWGHLSNNAGWICLDYCKKI